MGIELTDTGAMASRETGSNIGGSTGLAMEGLNGRSAADARADIARDQYADFLQRFNPFRRRLASMYDNPILRQEAIGNAGQNVRQAFDSLPERREERLRGLGLTLSDAQQQSIARQDDAAEALAMVTAKNRAQDAFEDRNEQIAIGINPGRVSGGA